MIHLGRGFKKCKIGRRTTPPGSGSRHL